MVLHPILAPLLENHVRITHERIYRGGDLGGLGDGSPPVGPGRSPVGGLGDEVPQKPKQCCKYNVKISMKNDPNSDILQLYIVSPTPNELAENRDRLKKWFKISSRNQKDL